MNNSEEYFTIQTATRKLGKTAKALKNYASLGYVDTEKREDKTFYNINNLLIKREVEHHENKNAKYLKPILELIEILSEYFPVAYLDSDEYDRLEEELIKYEKKCEKLGEEE